MNKTLFFLFAFTFFSLASKASEKPTVIYLFPGQGADYRLFNKLELDERFDTVHIHLPVPCKGESLTDYAYRFIPLIDTNRKFILLGVSLGGMICTELSTHLNPEKIILISSAKSNNELPNRYTFQKYIPINRITPKSLLKRGALFMQPIVEPDSKPYSEFFTSMLEAKDPDYLKRTIDMIINWEREFAPAGIFHIHGDNDSTIPIKNVKTNYIIKDGSHMMVYTKAQEINQILAKLLE